MKTTKHILIVLLSMVSVQVYAQPAFALWQGFSNKWTYNHRVNRIGDYISHATAADATAVSVHTAATGLGKDSAYFTSYYATVEAANIDYFTGKTSFELTAKEGKAHTVIKNIVLRPDSTMQTKERYVALLNGFDLLSLEDADKLSAFSVSISQPVYDNEKNELRFTIEARLKMDCSSIECSWLHHAFKYSLDIYYLILAGDSDAIAAKAMDYSRDIKWNTETETQPVPLEKSVSTVAGFNSGIFGYQQFSLQLDDEHHFADYENAITGTMLNPVNLSATCMMQLYFSNWKANMRKSAASGGQSFFAYAKKGSAVLSGKLQFVQFNGKVSYAKHDGALFWQGKNKSPESDAAVKKFAVPLR